MKRENTKILGTDPFMLRVGLCVVVLFIPALWQVHTRQANSFLPLNWKI